MEEKKGISRRQFLKLGAASAAAGVGIFISERLYPFIGLISEEKPGAVKPEDFLGVFKVADKIKTPVPEGDRYKSRTITLNKDAFANALYDTAKFMFPEDGPERLLAVLKKKPLEISLNAERSALILVPEEIKNPAGMYTPYFLGGPEITFIGDFFGQYRQAQISNNVQEQINNDVIIWHENVHLLQDIRNPFERIVVSFETDLKSGSAKFKLVKQPDVRQERDEVEARDISGKIAEAKWNEYLNKQDPKTWPFGQFFKYE